MSHYVIIDAAHGASSVEVRSSWTVDDHGVRPLGRTAPKRRGPKPQLTEAKMEIQRRIRERETGTPRHRRSP